MEQSAPLSNREHISIFGNTNSGKSSLFNCILNQDAAIVSYMHGTTTDPVIRAMELIPYGPVAFADTAGLNDKTILGDAREKRTRGILARTDLALYLSPANDFSVPDYEHFLDELNDYNIPGILVFTKKDLAEDDEIKNLSVKFPNALFVSVYDGQSVEALKSQIIHILSGLRQEDTIIGGLLPAGSSVMMVIPIDSAAPKGRLILPQVQLMRDCLDHGMTVSAVKPAELPFLLENLKKIDLAVVDSQIFGEIEGLIPEDIMLTSFSILFARHKGDIQEYIKGAGAVKSLKPGDKIAVTEGCTHNRTHEDIAQVKIPALLRKKAGGNLNFDFFSGFDFPENPSEYSLIIQCGGCMQNKREIIRRINLCKRADVPVTNFGILLAELNGILERSSRIFKK